jgi:hypothetical protein
VLAVDGRNGADDVVGVHDGARVVGQSLQVPEFVREEICAALAVGDRQVRRIFSVWGGRRLPAPYQSRGPWVPVTARTRGHLSGAMGCGPSKRHRGELLGAVSRRPRRRGAPAQRTARRSMLRLELADHRLSLVLERGNHVPRVLLGPQKEGLRPRHPGRRLDPPLHLLEQRVQIVTDLCGVRDYAERRLCNGIRRDAARSCAAAGSA